MVQASRPPCFISVYNISQKHCSHCDRIQNPITLPGKSSFPFLKSLSVLVKSYNYWMNKTCEIKAQTSFLFSWPFFLTYQSHLVGQPACSFFAKFIFLIIRCDKKLPLVLEYLGSNNGLPLWKEMSLELCLWEIRVLSKHSIPSD